jgi:hypothetical protein
MLTVFRFCGGRFGAAPVVVGGTAVADMYPAERRGRPDLYAFGLLLLEIGFWNTLSRLSATPKAKGAKLSPSAQSGSLVSKCKTDLACWMGEQYRDITLRCLNAENEDEGGVGGSLNEFYWSVVWGLMSCAEIRCQDKREIKSERLGRASSLLRGAMYCNLSNCRQSRGLDGQ